jgi:hypothetical protein
MIRLTGVVLRGSRCTSGAAAAISVGVGTSAGPSVAGEPSRHAELEIQIEA